jgi:DNA-binding PadR family transcriptional regulator
MFGTRHFGEGCEGRWAAGRHRRGRHHRGFGFGGRHGTGDGDTMRAGRTLAQGDLRLIALALIAEQPRHGYDIIKVLEEKTEGWYSPSPGIVYPTLTFLEEAGYLASQADGAKRLYTITAEGRAHLKENRAFADALLGRLAAAGERFARRRDEADGDRYGPRVPRLVRAALENLRDVAAERLKDDTEAEAKVVDVLARAAAELRRT